MLVQVYDAMSTDYDAVDEVASAMQASGEMLEGFAEGCTSDYSQQAKVCAAGGACLHVAVFNLR